MSFEGVSVSRLNGGLNRTNNSRDNVALLVLGAVAISGFELGKTYLLTGPEDAELLGLNVAYDVNNEVLVYDAIQQHFALAPDSIVYVHPVAKEQNPSAVFNDELKTVLRKHSDIRFIEYNSMHGVNNTALTTDIPIVQNWVNDLESEHIRIDAVILNGTGDANQLEAAYPDHRDLNCRTISINRAHDPRIDNYLGQSFPDVASAGAVTGMLAVRKVHENLGSVDIEQKPRFAKGSQDYPLTNAGQGRWLSAHLTGGTPFSALSNNLVKQLIEKGNIIAGDYDAYGGTYFGGSPTCASSSSDYAYIENNRVWNKAARAVRLALLPKVKGVLRKNPRTGKIEENAIKHLQTLAEKPLREMLNAEEISGFEIYINPAQNLGPNVPLIVKIQVAIGDIIHTIEIDLGLVKELQ